MRPASSGEQAAARKMAATKEVRVVAGMRMSSAAMGGGTLMDGVDGALSRCKGTAVAFVAASLGYASEAPAGFGQSPLVVL